MGENQHNSKNKIDIYTNILIEPSYTNSDARKVLETNEMVEKKQKSKGL